LGERLKVVLDTNIWISILLNKTLADEFLPLLRSGKIEVCISRALVKELARVISYPKIDALLRKGDVEPLVALAGIVKSTTLVRTKPTVREVRKDPADNRVLECAFYAKAKLIVSGDAHILELGEFKGIKIMTARKFLETMGA